MKANFKLVQQTARVGGEQRVDLAPTEEARARGLHGESIVFDLHMHGIVAPEDLSSVDLWIESARYELGYEGIEQAGLTAFIDGFAALGHNWNLGRAITEIGLRWCDMDRHHDQVIRALRADDVRRAKREGKTAIFTALENIEVIGEDVDAVDVLYGLGVRAAGLCYNQRNQLGCGRMVEPDSGLTRFGRTVIHRMNELGMLVDVTHAGVQTTLDVIETSSDPVVVSHAGAFGVHPTIRMSTDEELRAIAERGGLVGIHSGPNVLSNSERQTVESVIVRHIEYCVDLVGVDCVAIGSDNFFGDKNEFHRHLVRAHAAERIEAYVSFAAPYMEGFENPSEWPNMTRALVKAGYSDEHVRMLIGGNVLRVVEDVIG